jgi:penicillin amidase
MRPTSLLSFLALSGLCFLLAPAVGLAQQGQVDEETLLVPGLREPVEVRIDRWGIAHLRARHEEDLFFAQGWNAARDRLFQLELWRRQATGTTAELIGERGLERDIGARLHRYRGEIGAELRHYHPRGEAIVGAFVRGINAWIARTEAEPELLPLEFRLLGLKPGRWTPEIVVSRHQGLFGNLAQELSLARAVVRAGAAAVKDWNDFHPGDPELSLDPAINSERLLDPGIIRLYTAFREPLRFRPEDLLAEFRGSARPEDGLAATPGGATPWIESEDLSVGSNNWVVSGRLSQSGLPLMANDPHRVLQTPSLRYFVHLEAPGWNVIGGGEPALPGISIGHNGRGAWGLTIFRTDMEDLMVYETDPENPLRYRYRDGWEEMEVVRETFRVKGGEPVEVDLKYTRHGPVLHENPEHRVAFALRAAWLEKGCAPYLASLRINQAESWAAFRQACAFHQAPPLNLVWADRGGEIGWQVSAITPVRRGWSGLLPVPGDGSREWDGYLPIPLLPHLSNPPQGFWTTANEHVTPADYPYPEVLGFVWSEPYRGARVRELIGSGRRLGVTDLAAAQQDEKCLPAEALAPLLRDLPLEGLAASARERMRGWDHVLDRDSVEAGIYVAWEKRLEAALRESFVPEAARADIGTLSARRLVTWLTAPDGRFGADPRKGRDELAARCFTEAVANLAERFGPDPEAWRYGQEGYKHARIRHPLGEAVDEAMRERLEPGPLPRGGNGQTPNNTGGEDNQPTGATFRVVVDTADWDRAVGTSSPGQSGDPESPHYRDLFEPWARGQYFPLLYSAEKVDEATRRLLRLEPK